MAPPPGGLRVLPALHRELGGCERQGGQEVRRPAVLHPSGQAMWRWGAGDAMLTTKTREER